MARDSPWSLAVALHQAAVPSAQAQGLRSAMNTVPGREAHFGRPKMADYLRSGVRDQSDQHGEILSLVKIQNIWAWWCMNIIPATREAKRVWLHHRGLECSHVITAHYSLNLPGPGNSHTSDSQVAGTTTGDCQHTWLIKKKIFCTDRVHCVTQQV
ncbi:hypothetical protein AAY473_008686 [Plecturocebus cupreus]